MDISHIYVFLLVLIVSAIFLSYAVLLFFLTRGWKRLPNENPTLKTDSPTPQITIVAACHNEAENLPAFLQSITNQTLNATEIILVNDHSDDETEKILSDFASLHPKAKYYNSSQRGKKAALALAIGAAQSEIILCSDADCILPPTWVETVAAAYQQQPFDMLILPVTIAGCTPFAHLQTLEFATLIASGGAMAAYRKPIMCNGANLAFSRQHWLESMPHLHSELVSGDDMFMMHSFKKQHLHIYFLKLDKALAQTQASPNLKAFLRQRGRWTSKAGKYTDADTILVALLILLINICLLVLPIMAIFSAWIAPIWLAVFGGKWLLDGIFLSSIRNFFGLRHLFVYSLALSVVYPFYVLASIIGGFIPK